LRYRRFQELCFFVCHVTPRWRKIGKMPSGVEPFCQDIAEERLHHFYISALRLSDCKTALHPAMSSSCPVMRLTVRRTSTQSACRLPALATVLGQMLR